MTRTDLAAFSRLDPSYTDERIGLTAHMVATWHRFDLRSEFHLNSDRSRISFIVWYLLDHLSSRPITLEPFDQRLESALMAPIDAYGPLNLILHAIWRDRHSIDARFNIYTQEGYVAFAAMIVSDHGSETSTIRRFIPNGLTAHIDKPAFFDGLHYMSRGVKAYRDRIPTCTSSYDVADWRDREALNFYLLVHAFAQDGNELLLPPEVMRYWSGPASRMDPRLSRFMVVLAMMSERYSSTIKVEAQVYEHGDSIVRWFADEVLLKFPRLAVLVPIAATARVKREDLANRTRLERLTETYGFKAFPGQSDEEIDVLVIGPFAGASGLGTGTRRSVSALQALGCRVRVVNFMFDNPSASLEAIPPELAYKGERPRMTLWHYNGEYLPEVVARLQDFINPNYNVAFFFWETEVMPANHQLACDIVDEVWTPSEFVKKCYSDHGVPVHCVGTSVELPATTTLESPDHPDVTRTDFTFMFSFDCHSVIHRKNPAAVARAFKRAFPGQSEQVRLIIKTQNFSLSQWENFNGRGEELLELIDSDPRVVLINQTLSLDDLYSLKASIDCYVSLHRSEGFGYGPAEAMALGKPVIMTNYSANTEFGTDDNCFLVDASLVPVQRGEYLYWLPEMTWAEPDINMAAGFMRQVYSDPVLAKTTGDRAKETISRDFGRDALAAKYRERLTALGIL